jgi:signal transduction histidine kinase
VGRRSIAHRLASVRLRATLIAVVVLVFTVSLAALLLVRQQRAALTGGVQTAARLRADDLASVLATGELPASVAVPVDDTVLAQIVDARGRVVRASPNIDGEPPFANFPAPSRGYLAQTLTSVPVGGDVPFRVVARQVTSPTTRFTIYVGASLQPVTDGVRSLTLALVIVGPLLIIIIGVSTWMLIGRALEPLDAIRQQVDTLRPNELDRRVDETGSGNEVDRLARTMNAMLERLQHVVERERQFAADASHELRSPLTGIRAQLEVDLAHPTTADWQRTERDVLSETQRMQRLVDDLLILARGEGTNTGLVEPVDLDDVVVSEVRRLRTRGRVTVDARSVSACQVVGDRDALRRVVRNLLDNAERHAGGNVTVGLSERSGNVWLEVHDDGQGVAIGDHQQIFQRFVRTDTARDRDHGGSGLGLAIVREIVDAHGGSVAVGDNGPGASFIVQLPASGR